MPNMKRWSDAKLEKEHYFALAAKDENCPDNMKWLADVCAEMDRRNAIDTGDVDGQYGP